ncbi:MAG: pyridoxamine 5'-phosphate oxidase family protein [Geminicoccaceae bacterium]
MPATDVDSGELRHLYGEVHPLAVRKVLGRLDGHCRRFIGLSPFLVIGTSDADGRQDVSPRGDAPGFVRVLDDRTLLLPDRPGNNRVDTLGNIATQPNVALIFFIPGVDETLRVNGRGRITTDPDLLAPSAVQGKAPRTALVVSIEECFLHCGKALIRSHLWDADRKIPRNSFPSLARMISDQIEGVKVDDAEAAVDHSYRNTLY